MTNAADPDPGYPDDDIGMLEAIWGEGFMSPGGPAEVTRTLGGHDIAGCAVLDVGCGIGGVDFVLVEEHGAGSVTGVDVEQALLDIAASRTRKRGLDERITYRRIEPGEPLPFADEAFDVLFSKDSILHVDDKRAFYGDGLRVLRPGGRLLVGDWMRGEGDELTPMVSELVAEAGHNFSLLTFGETERIVEDAGFTEPELVDRRAWCLEEARDELERLRGPLKPEFLERWGDYAPPYAIGFWEVMVRALESGALCPGHIRAAKPA